MRQVFADAQFFIALLNVNDQSRPAAVAANQALGGVRLVTTEEVLTEVLAFFAKGGRHLRQLAAEFVADLLDDPETTVLPQTHDSFVGGFDLYKARPDKGYSLTDAISMATMTRLGITAILTHDHHFAQEAFRTLL